MGLAGGVLAAVVRAEAQVAPGRDERHALVFPSGIGAQAPEAAVPAVVVRSERARHAVERRRAHEQLHRRKARRGHDVVLPLFCVREDRERIRVVGLMDRSADDLAGNRPRAVDRALRVEARVHAVFVRRRAADDVVGAFQLGDRAVVVYGRAIHDLSERLNRVTEALGVRALGGVPDSDQRRAVHIGGQLHETARDRRVEAHLRDRGHLDPVDELGQQAVGPERVAELRRRVEREEGQLVERKTDRRHDVEPAEAVVSLERPVAVELSLLDADDTPSSPRRKPVDPE